MNSGEDSAFPMVSSSSSASLKYEGSVSLSPDSSWKIIEYWKWDDGISPWGNTPHCAKAQRLFHSALLTLEMKCWAEFR